MDDGAVLATPPRDDGGSSDVEGGELRDEDTISDRILGVVVKFERHRNDDGSNRDSGIRVVCPHPAHLGHSRYRSVRMNSVAYGPRGAEYYLGAWLAAAAVTDEDAHRKFKPTRANIDAFKASLG
jgi:hypothetical protein